MKALELADAYADAVAAHRLESLYGTSKSYTLEKAKERDESFESLAAELRRLAAVEADCAPYLREGETPAERIKRALADADSLMNLYRDAVAELERIKALEPQQERGPMTTAQITDARKKDCFDPDDEPEPWSFRMGVVAAERHHGIMKD